MKLFEVVMMVVYKICGCMIKNGTSGNHRCIRRPDKFMLCYAMLC